MQVINIGATNSVQNNKQSFGSLKQLDSETLNYLHQKVFKNNTVLVDSFTKTLEKVAKRQANNDLVDIKIVKESNTSTGGEYPIIFVIDKKGKEMAQYQPLGPNSIMRALEIASNYASNLISK